jgi:hypothetical protein
LFIRHHEYVLYHCRYYIIHYISCNRLCHFRFTPLSSLLSPPHLCFQL